MTGETRGQRLRRLADERAKRLATPRTTSYQRQWERGQTIKAPAQGPTTQRAKQ